MEYLLIPLGCALASLKVTIQSKFSKVELTIQMKGSETWMGPWKFVRGTKI